MQGIAWHREIPIGEDTRVLQYFSIDRRALLAHIVGVREIAVKSQHRELTVGDPFLFAAANQPAYLFGKFLQKCRALLLAPKERQAIERSGVRRRRDLSFPFRIEQIFDFLRHFIGANQGGVVGQPGSARYDDQHPPLPVNHRTRDVRKNLRPLEFLQSHPRHVIFRADKEIAGRRLAGFPFLDDAARQLRHRRPGSEFERQVESVSFIEGLFHRFRAFDPAHRAGAPAEDQLPFFLRPFDELFACLRHSLSGKKRRHHQP